MLTRINESICKTTGWATLALLLMLSSAIVSCSQDMGDDADWLIVTLNLEEGSTVAEVGVPPPQAGAGL